MTKCKAQGPALGRSGYIIIINNNNCLKSNIQCIEIRVQWTMHTYMLYAFRIIH